MDTVDVYGTSLELDSHELLALVGVVSGNSKIHFAEHRIVHDDGELEIVFKTGHDRILTVGPRSASASSTARRLRDLIDAHLLQPAPINAVHHDVVFADHLELHMFDKQVEFGRSGDFTLHSEPASPAPLHMAGHPCQVTVGYAESGLIPLDVFRRDREFLRVRNLLAGLAPAATDIAFSDPYGATITQRWCTWTTDRAHAASDTYRPSRVVQLGYTIDLLIGPNEVTGLNHAGAGDWVPIHEALNVFERLSDDDRSAFLAACGWVHHATTAPSSSLRLLALTTAIETLLALRI